MHRYDGDPSMPLLWFLRDVANLTGTKYGCGMALCGACTVHLDGQAIRSCLTPVGATVGKKVTTIEGVARTAPYFSLADVARFLNPRLDAGGHAIFEGPFDDSSSLVFYLNQKFLLVNQNRQKAAPIGRPPIDIFVNEDAVLEKWPEGNAVFLIVEQSRADYWKQVLTSRFHIYHQLTASGTYVVLSNQL